MTNKRQPYVPRHLAAERAELERRATALLRRRSPPHAGSQKTTAATTTTVDTKVGAAVGSEKVWRGER
jgi:hypothetical protein